MILPELPPPPPLAAAWAERAPVHARADADGERGEDTSAFNIGQVDVRLGFSAAGFGAGPLSLLSSAIGWYILDLTFEIGVIETEMVVVGVGAEVWTGRPLLAELAANAALGLVDFDANWKARDRGLMGRVALHRAGLTTFDPYVVAMLGPTSWFIEGSATRDGVGVSGRSASGGLRTGVGAGVNRIADSGFLWGIELRYLAGLRYTRDQAITYTNAQGEEETLFELRGVMKPPRGFSWVAGIGWRF